MKDLRSSLQALSERGTPIGSDLLRQRVAVALAAGGGRLRPAAGRRVAPGWALAAAFAVTILGVGLPVYLLLRGGEEAVSTTVPVTTSVPATTSIAPPTTTEATTTTAAATTTTTMAGPPPNLMMQWQRVAEEALADGGNLTGLIATDSGFVAAGGANAFVSENGTAWQRSAEGTFGPTGGLSDVAAGPDDQLVAVGVSDSQPAIWTSPDGLNWTGIERDGAVFPAAGRLAEVVFSDGGWVAVGQSEVDGWAGPAGSFLGMWASSDAVTWEQVVDPVDPGWGNAHVTELLAWHGAVYALGYTQDPTTYLVTPAVWRSEDGREWLRVNRDSGGDVGKPDGYPDWGAWIEGATATDAALFGVGVQVNWMEPPEAWSLAVWRSEDGLTWSLLPTEFQVPGRSTHGSELKPIAGDGERLVAIELCTYVWASDDQGDTWHQVAELEMAAECGDGMAWSLAFDGTQFIAAGFDGADSAIWVGAWTGG